MLPSMIDNPLCKGTIVWSSHSLSSCKLLVSVVSWGVFTGVLACIIKQGIYFDGLVQQLAENFRLKKLIIAASNLFHFKLLNSSEFFYLPS